VQPGVNIRASDITLRWKIELKCMDDQQIEINLQLVYDKDKKKENALVYNKENALYDQQIQILVEENNRLKEFNKIIIIRNIWGLHQTLQMCGNDLFIDYFYGFDFVNREDKWVQRFYNVLANGTFVQISILTPVFRALENKLDPNYPITIAPQNEALDIISNVGPMHTLFTRIVHCMMQVIAFYNTNIEKNKNNIYNNVQAHLLILNTMANNADFTKLLCGTSKSYPAAGTIKQMADQWFEPLIRHVSILVDNEENRRTIGTLTKLCAATWL
jgi:hypothetical protein